MASEEETILAVTVSHFREIVTRQREAGGPPGDVRG